MRLSLPPLTKLLLISVITLSFAVFVVRYHTYYVWSRDVAHRDQQKLDESSSHSLGDGKNFPADQRTLSQSPDANNLFVPFLTIVPGVSHFYFPWILITASFVEESLLALAFTATTLMYAARYCENVWGSRELLRFVALQTLVPNTLALIFYLVVYWVTDPPSRKLVTVCGSTAVVSGFLVAFKQLVPEHSIVLFRGLLRFKVRHLPMAFLLTCTVMGLLLSDLYAIHAWTGFLTSWCYLRFVRTTYVDPVLPFSGSSSLPPEQHMSPEGSIAIRGDASDSFAISQFFPEPFQLVVDKLATPVYSLLVKMRVVRGFTAQEIDAADIRAQARIAMTPPMGGGGGGGGASPKPTPLRSSARAEAERRRSLALRALESQQTL